MALGFDHLLDKMNDELNEVDIPATAQKMGAGVKKALAAVPVALRKIYEKMSKAVKAIEPAWFRFHAAICKLVNNKYALYNNRGEKVTPDLDYMKRVTYSGKKKVPMYQHESSKNGKIKGHLQPDGSVAVAKMHPRGGVPIFYLGPTLWAPAKVGVAEDAISDADRILLEKICLEVMAPKEAEKEYMGVRKQAEAEFNIQSMAAELSKRKDVPVAESIITVGDLEETLEDMADIVEAGAAGEKRKLSMLLYGPPGVGKSEVITEFFEKRGWEVTLLQIQHVPIETLAGFPVIDMEGKMTGRKGVTMQVSDVMPEQGSTKKHLLFLDEFNAGSQEQMKAAMNLALTGKIGTYVLPKNTIAIAAGNAGEVDNATAVNELDAPTLRRFMYKMRMEYSLPDWLKFSKKDTIIDYKNKKINTGPVLSIITSNLLKWTEESKDPQAAFQKVMKGFGGEAESGWLDPATWTSVDRMTKLKGLKEYSALEDAQKKNYQELGKKSFKDMKDVEAVGARAYIVASQADLFKSVAPRLLGKDSEELVSEMVLNYEELKKQAVSSRDVLLNYKGVREKIKGKSIDHEIMMNEMAQEIANFGSKTAMKKYMKEKGIKYYESAKSDPLTQALMNVGQFVKDLDIGAEIITAHFESLAPALEMKNQLAIDYKAGLLQLGIDRIKAGWDGFMQSIDKQFEQIATGDDKKKYMQMMKSGETYEPIEKAAVRIKDPELKQRFINTETKNFILHERKKKKTKKEEAISPLTPDITITEDMLKLAGVKRES